MEKKKDHLSHKMTCLHLFFFTLMYEELDLPPRKSIKKKFQEHKAFKEVIVRVFFAQDCDSMKVAISFRL